MAIRPINGHLAIEPLEHESFLEGKTTYEQIGVVVDVGTVVPPIIEVPDGLMDVATEWLKQFPTDYPKKGDKVYFDSWLAAKYPKGDGSDGFYWLVKFEDIRAVEDAN